MYGAARLIAANGRRSMPEPTFSLNTMRGRSRLKGASCRFRYCFWRCEAEAGCMKAAEPSSSQLAPDMAKFSSRSIA